MATRVSGVGNFITHESFSEQWTGRYDPNGDKIYRNTYNLAAQGAGGGTETIPIGVVVNRVLLDGGYVLNTGTGGTYPLPYTNTVATANQVSFEITNAKADVLVNYGTNFQGGGGAFHLEYTKA